MSKISDIIDTLDTFITDNLATHKEMSNPYFPETEADITYAKAYGLAAAEGLNLEKLDPDSDLETKSRIFIISLTRRVFGPKRSPSLLRTETKNVFEDQRILTTQLVADETLGKPALIVSAKYLSDGGLEFVRANRQDILIVRTLISVEYHENC